MASKIISFRLPEELLPLLSEQCQEGESINDVARRIVVNAVGGQLPLPPVPATDVQKLISAATAEQSESVNNRLHQLSDEIKVTVEAELAQYREDVDGRLQLSNTEIGVTIEALVEEKLAQRWKDVDGRLQVSNIEIKTMVESMIEEKLTQVPVKIPSNIPTQTQFQEMHTRINDFRGSLLREIQNRDKSINLFAEQIAELTARLDTMPSGVSREELEKARDKILQNWKIVKGVEKKERIKQGINKVIDDVYPQE